MQSQLENINTSWSRDEIAQLIDYAKHLQSENEDLQAKMIMMNAKLGNEEAKTKQLKNLLNTLMYGNEGNIN
jgi:hypothetical protein